MRKAFAVGGFALIGLGVAGAIPSTTHAYYTGSKTTCSSVSGRCWRTDYFHPEEGDVHQWCVDMGYGGFETETSTGQTRWGCTYEL